MKITQNLNTIFKIKLRLWLSKFQVENYDNSPTVAKNQNLKKAKNCINNKKKKIIYNF